MTPLSTYVVETIVMLLGVIVLAVLVVYGARRAGVGRAAGPIELVGRLPLDARRAVYLVRVGRTVFVLGASEAGLNKLGELPDEGMDLVAGPAPGASFSYAIRRALGKTPPETGAE